MRVNIYKTHDVINIPAHFGIVSGVGYSTQLEYGPQEIVPIVPQQ
jgi:hypothetical protein